MMKAVNSKRLQRAIALLGKNDAQKLTQAMDKNLAKGMNEHDSFDAAWDEVMGF